MSDGRIPRPDDPADRLDERLGRLVEELPTRPAPDPAWLSRHATGYRTPRWMLLVIAILLVLAAAVAYAWLTEAAGLPAGSHLHCARVDPFRCHDAAVTAVGAVSDVANLPVDVRGLSVGDIDVVGDPQPVPYCNGRCPTAAEQLRGVTGTDLVTVDYLRGGKVAVAYQVRVVQFTDGHRIGVLQNMPIVRRPLGGARQPG
jgi:hypothetical protein